MYNMPNYSYYQSPQSNETSQTYFLERTQSAKITLEKALKICPQTNIGGSGGGGGGSSSSSSSATALDGNGSTTAATTTTKSSAARNRNQKSNENEDPNEVN